MLKKIVLAEDPFNSESWEMIETDNVCEFLRSRFNEFPATARIYHDDVSCENDVTPSTDEEIEKLISLEGTFIVVVYPAGATALIVGALIAVISAVAFQVEEPVSASISTDSDSTSANNDLSSRANSARINGRIPDIFGNVVSIPDLIAQTYTLYSNNVETQHSLMCIGVGEYEIPEDSILEGSTKVSEITGSTVEVFGPDVLPSPINEPQVRVGDAIGENFVSTIESNAVNGQTLNPDLDETIIGSFDIALSANWRELSVNEYFLQTNNSTTDFRNYFKEGDEIEVTLGSISLNALVYYSVPLSTTLSFLKSNGKVFVLGGSGGSSSRILKVENGTASGLNIDGVYRLGIYNGNLAYQEVLNPFDVNPNWRSLSDSTHVVYGADSWTSTTSKTINPDGIYSVSGVEEKFVYLSDPVSTNQSWEEFLYENVAPTYRSPELENLTGSAIGPFTIDDENTTEIIINDAAANGLYKSDGTTQESITVYLETVLTPVDAQGDPIGDAETFYTEFVGSSLNTTARYITSRFIPLFGASRYTVERRRTTPFVTGFTGTIAEDITWINLYGASSIESFDFGNVTTVRAKTVASTVTSGISELELSLDVTRKIPQRISGNEFTTELYPTSRADDIISFISMDQRIGNRSKDELDFDNIYQTVADIEEYFGTSIPTEFNYTFDSNNLSYEETMATIAKTIFCKAYRRGSQIKLSFEKETVDSTLLFNHRNKLPGTETRTIRFGNQENWDGVELDYTDPEDNSSETFYIPEDASAINPSTIEVVGIRNRMQAHFHAWRAWNKIRYQNTSSEFEATQETDLLVLGDRILNADNTRPHIQDGQVVSQYGLELELSQKVDLTEESSYIIFLQHYDGTIESIGVSEGSTSRSVILDNAPKQSLSLDSRNYAVTTYLIVGAYDTESNAFLVTEKNAPSNYTSIITAINYDSRYYDNDKDYSSGIINEDGNEV